MIRLCDVFKVGTAAIHAMDTFDVNGVVAGDKKGGIVVLDVQKGPRDSNKPSKGESEQESFHLFQAVSKFQWNISDIKGIHRPLDCAIRSLAIQQGSLLVTTGSSEILEAKILASPLADWDWKSVMKGHYTGECWGLALHPKLATVATGKRLSTLSKDSLPCIDCLIRFLLFSSDRW